MSKRALISVTDKTGISAFAKELVNLGFEIISTGGTKKVLEQEGIKTLAVEEITGFPEMMDGRVKTLHPKIHGALLGRRDQKEHLQAMIEQEITPIDLICVNLYQFKETISKPQVTLATAIENIDIGGPAMLRSAAKNQEFVTVVIDPKDYAQVLSEIKENGDTDIVTRRKLAAKVFRYTAAYDALIAEYLTKQVNVTAPEKLTKTYDLKQSLRYGENPQQKAYFYQDAQPCSFSLASARQLNGKELSFNNIRDANAALQIIREFDTTPTVVALKHSNPCGIGTGKSIEEAWDRAYAADSTSIFGGIIVLNGEVDATTAQKMHDIFLEVIIAPSYSKEALEILTTKKKNLRLLELNFAEIEKSKKQDLTTSVLGGLLVQNQDVIVEDSTNWQVVTKRKPTDEEMRALKFAWKVIKHVKSNAIVVTNENRTLGIGAGQMNRVGSVKIALNQAKEHLDGAVLASDAYFPFADNVEEAAKAGIKAIIQPGGSIRDNESIEMADKYDIAMVFTNVRHFLH